jgi:hypothetical protein
MCGVFYVDVVYGYVVDVDVVYGYVVDVDVVYAVLVLVLQLLGLVLGEAHYLTFECLLFLLFVSYAINTVLHLLNLLELNH